jgi:hypothetical protein
MLRNGLAPEASLKDEFSSAMIRFKNAVPLEASITE